MFPLGSPAYKVDSAPVLAIGVTFSAEEVDTALSEGVCTLLWDDAGKDELAGFLTGLANTQFEEDRLSEVLNQAPTLEDWRVGEAMAEAYLIAHRSCEFPWPTGRDLKNPAASPAGTDLVGFQHGERGTRFAFGEVKTSQHAKWPPSVVTGRHGLSEQVEALNSTTRVKAQLVTYLGLHAVNASWAETFKRATKRYLTDPTDVTLFGILVRDVGPDELDLRSRARALGKIVTGQTSIELNAIYLPAGSITQLPKLAAQARGGSS
jgi:hypothetical protein